MTRNIQETWSFYRGEDCIQKFIKCMFEEVKNCQEVIREHFNKPIKMTRGDTSNFKNAKRCHICKKKIWGG